MLTTEINPNFSYYNINIFSKILDQDITLVSINKLTYVAFPSLRNTQLSVHSNLALVIFFVVGLNVSCNSCCDGSILAYFFILILDAATCRRFPFVATLKKCLNFIKVHIRDTE